MARLPPRFVALSPGDLSSATARDFLARAAAALEAGLPGLMLREPGLSDREFLTLAQGLAARAKHSGTWFCVHDRVHAGLAVEADAVHLGFHSLPPAQARSLLPASMGLGLSTHDGDPPERLADCDYRIHGPVFDTPSKQGIQTAIGLEGIARALALSEIPLLAIGGLLPEHFASLRDLGVHGVCARAGVFRSGDSLQATLARVQAWVAALEGRTP
ncbi:MAG TPA: thiamine phosphate synthase [Planctomycetota bacterium]|nr:thiamine phosphate synthase [Planctomycetota bacterium]